jgi:Fe-S oxidoreductase/nitrate reductase gamma subunit
MPSASPAELILAAASPPLMREVFGNIPGWAKGLFYVVAAIAVGVWAYGLYRRVRLWRQGKPSGGVSYAAALKRVVRDVLLQGRFRGRPFASLAHVLLFSGFFVLLIGTTLVAIEHILADLLGRPASDPVFHKGLYYAVYELVTDSFGVAFLVGCTMFLVRRLRGGGSFAKTQADVGMLVLLIVIGVTGYVVEGLRIIHAATPLPGLSPVGYVTANLFTAAGVDQAGAGRLHFALWWLHAALALGFIAWMPYSRLLHSLAGAINLALRQDRLGTMRPISMAEVEETGLIGVAQLADFTRRQLVELDACVSCGRCQDACPAFEAGKPLSPRNVVQDLVGVMNVRGVGGKDSGDRSQESGKAQELGVPLAGGVIADETLWSCTTCGACVDICPLGVSPMGMITDMRRFLIGDGALRGSPATALQKTDRVGNPFGLPQKERLAWAAGLDVPLASENPDYEVLYWVGCAAAYDRRAQKIARSVVRLLQAADVNFAVLGPEERCTGESARRMGDELLFQQLAEQNVATLGEHRAKRIVAHCPHCVNSLRNDYPQAGGDYEVVHHSQLLSELVAAGKLPSLPTETSTGGSITYHDPCYLTRANGITDEPRAVLAAVAGQGNKNGAGGSSLPIIELPRNRRETSCCGGGGGRMWFDDAPSQRVGRGRVEEIVGSGAETVAVSCPFCLIMVGDGVAAEKPAMQVRDIAELLAEATLGPERSAMTDSPSVPPV